MNVNTTVTDPVCGMTIDPAQAAAKTTYRGQTFHFCAASCLRTFAADPENYARPMETAGCCTSDSCC